MHGKFRSLKKGRKQQNLNTLHAWIIAGEKLQSGEHDGQHEKSRNAGGEIRLDIEFS